MNSINSFLLILLTFISMQLNAESTKATQDNPLFLKNRFLEANIGDYIVYLQGKNYHLIRLYSRIPEKKKFILQEVTIPQVIWKGLKVEWINWIESDVPQNSSHVLYELNENIEILNAFSVTRNTSFELEKSDNLFFTLLELPFEKIPLKERRQLGPFDPNQATNYNKIWNPPLFIDGKSVSRAKFDAYRCKWPNDTSELSEKIIEIYMPSKEYPCPNYLPFWLQTGSGASSGKIRAISSGLGTTISTKS